MRGWARRKRNWRSLPSSTLSQSKDLSTNYSLPIKVLSWAELSKADSSFEQPVSSNIQYPGVYWSFCIGCFSPFSFLLRSSCIRFLGFLSMPCVLKGAANSCNRSRWGINKTTTRKKNKDHKGAFLSSPAQNQVLQLLVVGKKMGRIEGLGNLYSPSSTLYSDAPYVVLCLVILSTLLDSWIQS